MASIDLRAFVRANLPEPPARVLEVGAVRAASPRRSAQPATT